MKNKNTVRGVVVISVLLALLLLTASLPAAVGDQRTGVRTRGESSFEESYSMTGTIETDYEPSNYAVLEEWTTEDDFADLSGSVSTAEAYDYSWGENYGQFDAVNPGTGDSDGGIITFDEWDGDDVLKIEITLREYPNAEHAGDCINTEARRWDDAYGGYPAVDIGAIEDIWSTEDNSGHDSPQTHEIDVSEESGTIEIGHKGGLAGCCGSCGDIGENPHVGTWFEEIIFYGEGADFVVDITDHDDEVDGGDTVEVDYEVTNEGGVESTQDVTLYVEGSQEDSEEETLTPGDTSTGTLSWETDEDDSGEHELIVTTENDDDTATVDVNAQPYFEVDIEDYDEMGSPGDDIIVDFLITNTGDKEDTHDVVFTVDGLEEDRYEDETLGGGDTFDDEFVWSASDYDTYSLEVSTDDDSETVEVEIVEDSEFIVEMTDYDDEVYEGDTVNVDFFVTNEGEQKDTQSIELKVEGSVEDSTTVELGENDDETGTLAWTTEEGDGGHHNATLHSEDDESETVIIDVLIETFFEVELLEHDDQVGPEDEASTEYELTNIGDVKGERDVTEEVLDENDMVVLSETNTVELEGEKNSVEVFSWIPKENNLPEGTYTVEIDTGDDYIEADTVVQETEPADLQINLENHPEAIDAGDIAYFDYEVENVGDETADQSVVLEIDGDEKDSNDVEVEGGNSKRGVLQWQTDVNDIGFHDFTVSTDDDYVTGEIEVDGDEPEEPFFEVDIQNPEDEDEFEIGENIDISARVENTGDASGEASIELSISIDSTEVFNSSTSTDEIDEGDYIAVEDFDTWDTSGEDEGEYDIEVSTDDDRDEISVDLDDIDGPSFDVEILSPDEDDFEPNEELTVEYKVENVGNEDGSGNVTLFIDDDEEDSTELVLESGEEETRVFTTNAPATEGSFDVRVETRDDEDTVSLTVSSDEPAPDEPEFEITIEDESDETVEEGEEVLVVVSIENVGGESDDGILSLYVGDDDEVDFEVCDEIAPGDSVQEKLVWETDGVEAGEYWLRIEFRDAEEKHTVEVEESDTNILLYIIAGVIVGFAGFALFLHKTGRLNVGSHKGHGNKTQNAHSDQGGQRKTVEQEGKQKSKDDNMSGDEADETPMADEGPDSSDDVDLDDIEQELEDF